MLNRRRKGWLALLPLFWCFSVQAAESWTPQEKAAEAIYFSLHTVDWGQTRSIAADPGHYHESFNSVLGPHPTRQRVDVWFLSMSILQPLVANALPHSWRSAWISAGAMLELDMVNKNAALGLSMAW